MRLSAAMASGAIAAAVIAAGCGGVPGGAVATVDGDAITRESLDHWTAVVAKSGGRPGTAAPKPPEREALRARALQLLISFSWIEREAEDRGISVDDDAVRASFEQLKQRSFPEEADYRRFLSASGQTEADILARVHADLLSSRIREQVVEDTEDVAGERVAAHYDAHRARFTEPERRDLRVVVTGTSRRAEQAMAALSTGRSWKSVAAEYSIDPATRSRGGRLPGVAEGEQPKALDEAAFRAAKGTIGGPVGTPAGYYVFIVVKVKPAEQQTLDVARPAIVRLLTAEAQQDALERYLDDFRRKWRAKTECSDGYLTADCGNA